MENETSRGLLMVLNNAQVDAYQEQQNPDSASVPVLSGLASHVDAAWTANKTAKQPIERILLECLRMRNGEYEPEVLEQMRKTGEENPVYMMIPDIKCRAAISWIKDVLLPAGEAPFRLDPTPKPDLPPQQIEEIKQRIVVGLQSKMQASGITKEQLTREDVLEVGKQVKKELEQIMDEEARTGADEQTENVNDEMLEGHWYDALDDFVDDFVTYPAAFVEGPVPRKERRLEWTEQGPKPTIKIVRTYSWVSPYDVYPSSGAKTLNDGNLIIRKRYSPTDLQAMIGVDGYDSEAIRLVLDQYARGGLKEWLSVDTSRDYLEDHHNTQGDPEPQIDCLKFMGNIQGRSLLEWGMSEDQIPDPIMMYPAIVHKIGPHIICARLNDDPLGHRNYHCASFVKKAGSIWGRGVCQVMRDNARICNSAARAIVRNMGIASGPMSWVVEDKLMPGQNANVQAPWKVWRFSSMDTKGGVPMGWFAPPTITEKLLAIYKYFYDQASEVTGIPAYLYGSEKVGGAGTTASGLSMLMNSASKGLKAAIMQIDKGIIKPCVEAHWLSIMIEEPERASGDIKVIARASDYLMQIEQQQLALFDALQLTNNPVDMQIIGPEGRGEMLREYMKRLKIPSGNVVPDRDAIIDQTSEAKIQEFVQALATAMKVDPQQLIAMAQTGPQEGGPTE